MQGNGLTQPPFMPTKDLLTLARRQEEAKRLVIKKEAPILTNEGFGWWFQLAIAG